jgi:glutamate carboxypeptidase
VTEATTTGPGELALAAAAWLAPRRADMLSLLRALIHHDSPSGQKVLLAQTAALLKRHLDPLAREHEVIDSAHGPRLLFRIGPPGRGPLVLGHYDTVWPAGTASERPFAVKGSHLTGPGVFDMKASIVMTIFALEALRVTSGGFPQPITVSLTPDEETGNPSSRSPIEQLAREASFVAVLEPPLPGGALKTRRKGIASVHIDVRGVAAHAGLEPERGASAALEVARLTLEAADLADVGTGTTVNVGVLQAGDRRNVVPARGELVVDVRSWQEEEIRRVLAALARTTPSIPGVTFRVSSLIHRPPMERNPGIEPVLARARAASAALGLALEEGEAGGGSEANFTGSLAPTLDGLGPEGGGAHALDEHVDAESLFARTALLTALLAG